MRENPKTSPIRIDLSQFKLHIDLKKRMELTLHFNSPSRRFYLSLIAFVVNEMKRLGKITSIPLEEHWDLLVLLNDTVGGSAGSSDKENLLPRIYRKWKDALPDLEDAPLFKVLGRKKKYDEGAGKTYPFTEAEKDNWANLFEYLGSNDKVRLKFAIDKIGASLSDVVILYEDSTNGEAWDRFLSSLKPKVEEASETRPIQPVSEALESPLSIPSQQRTGLQNRYRWPALIAMVVAMIGAGTWVIHDLALKPGLVSKASVERMTYPLPDKPSIAVLPFANLSGDPKEDYFSDGLSEQIITSLSMVPGLFVIARNSTFVYKGKAVKVQTVAEEQGVRYVLEGGVQRSQHRVRVTVQLIDAIKGRHLWAERYDREMKDLFALQDEIVKHIMTGVQVKLTEGEYASAIGGSTSDLKALECYWRALEHSNRWSREDNATSREWLEKAIVLDPNFAAAWALLASSYNVEVMYGWAKSPADSQKRFEECVQKALSIDGSTPLALSYMGGILTRQGKWDEGLAYNEKALSINPNDPRIMFFLALALEARGRFDEAIAMGQKILRISPYYPAMYLSYLASVYPAAGRYEEAIKVCELMLEPSRKGELNPVYAHLFLAEAYVGLGQLDEARAHAEQVMKIDPKYSLEGHKRLTFYRDPAIGERRLEALRKAGLTDKPPLTLPDKPSIAVLPFVNMSDDPQQEYFGDGMTQDLITDLSKVSGLLVIAWNSSLAYKGKSLNVRQISRELGVKYVLEGSVRRAGDQLRINAQLLDAATGQNLWAERYDGRRKDIFALQDKINQKIVAALAVKLTEGEKIQVAQKWTQNPVAYDEYLKGREHTARLTAGEYDKAEACYKRAIQLDPKFTQARAALASLYLNRAQFGLGKKGGLLYLHDRLRAAQYLREAMKEPTALAYRLSGDMDLLMRVHETALSKMEKALSLDPNDPSIHASLSWALSMVGRPAEAIEHAKRAMRLDPINPDRYLYNIGVAHFCLGNMEEAIAVLEKSLKVNPEQTVAAGPLAAAYARLGRNEEAKTACETLRRDWGDAMFVIPGVMYNYPFKDRRVADSLSEGLKKAGMPGELSNCIHVSREDQITGDDLRAFYYPSTITGGERTGHEWSLDRTKDGRLTIRSSGVSGGMDTGKSWLEGDKVCSQFQAFFFGMTACSTTFKNPRGTFDQQNEYVQFGDHGISIFSKTR